jgi:hypothetical protein
MKKLNQKGILDVMLILAIVVVVAVGGFVLYRISSSEDAKENVVDSSANANSDEESALVPSSTTCGKDWTVIEHETAVIEEWGVEFTIDKGMIGEAVCRKDRYNPQYFISTKAVTDMDTCYKYLQALSLSDPVVSIWRYDANESALGNLTIDDSNTQTFQEFYDQNKDSAGNYVVPATKGDDSKYYYVAGSFFYQTGSEVYDHIGVDMDKYTEGIQAYEINETELSAKCPNVSKGYVNNFGDIASTLRESSTN